MANMANFKLPSENGVRHLPKPSGPFSVGWVDVFTAPRGEGVTGLLLRLYYPAAPTQTHTEDWGRWFPLPQYASGYIRYKFSSLGAFVPLLGRMFLWLSGDPRIPASQGSRILNNHQRKPVVVFSHGLAACRTSYSFLCTDLASRGYFVAAIEHGEGSGCLRSVKNSKNAAIELKYQDLLAPGTPEYDVRNKQVKLRASEACEALDSLDEMNNGNLENIWIQNLSDEKLDGLRNDLMDSMNLDMVTIAGHSFGGATTALGMTMDARFKVGVALDSWMFPIREEKLNKISPEKLLFINCEKFQGTKNLQTMKRFEGNVDNGIPSNVLTVLKATHYAPTDIPIIMEGSSANTLYRMIGGGGETPEGLSNRDSLKLFSELFHNWVQRGLGLENSFRNQVSEHKEYLKYGIDL